MRSRTAVKKQKRSMNYLTNSLQILVRLRHRSEPTGLDSNLPLPSTTCYSDPGIYFKLLNQYMSHIASVVPLV